MGKVIYQIPIRSARRPASRLPGFQELLDDGWLDDRVLATAEIDWALKDLNVPSLVKGPELPR